MITPKIEIIQIPNPTIEIDGELKPVVSKIYLSLSKFQEEIDLKFSEGFTKCYFYNITTHKDDGYIFYIIRSRFVK